MLDGISSIASVGYLNHDAGFVATFYLTYNMHANQKVLT